MIWRHKEWKHITLAAFAVLCLPLAASAQDAQVDTQISEDLRVMSALVDETVGDFYEKLGTANCMSCHTANSNFNNLSDRWRSGFVEGQFGHGSLSDWHFGGTPDAAESTYLAGVGVVIQLSAPAFPDSSIINVEADIVEGTPSRWEQMRQKLEGGAGSGLASGVTIDLKAVHLTKDDLVEQLVSLLADSAHNFRNLAMDDQIALSITFEAGRNSQQIWSENSSFDLHNQGDLLGGEGAGGDNNQAAVNMLGNVPLINSLFAQQSKKPLPERLTVIANKSDLDALHAGNLTKEQFRDTVTVRVITPASDETVED